MALTSFADFEEVGNAPASGVEMPLELAFRRAKQGSVKQLVLLLAYAEGKPATGNLEA